MSYLSLRHLIDAHDTYNNKTFNKTGIHVFLFVLTSYCLIVKNTTFSLYHLNLYFVQYVISPIKTQ